MRLLEGKAKLELTINSETPITRAEWAEMFSNQTQQIKEYIDERTHDAETRLLRAFGDYQQAETTRFRHMKADLGNLNVATDERLAAIEQRLTHIDKRLIEKSI